MRLPSLGKNPGNKIDVNDPRSATGRCSCCTKPLPAHLQGTGGTHFCDTAACEMVGMMYKMWKKNKKHNALHDPFSMGNEVTVRRSTGFKEEGWKIGGLSYSKHLRTPDLSDGRTYRDPRGQPRGG